MNLNSKIENQKRGGKGDTLPSNDYYTNSYVDRLKLLGSDIQYSTTFGGQSSNFTINDGLIHLTSIYIPKTSVISGVSWYQGTQGNYTADNYNGIGIYSFNAITKNLTLVGSTDNDGDIWKTIGNSLGSKNFSTPLTLEAGVYYIAALYNNSAQTTAPSYAYNGLNIVSTTISGLNLTLPSNVYLNAVTVATNTTLPGTILSTDIVSNSVSYIYWLY